MILILHFIIVVYQNYVYYRSLIIVMIICKKFPFFYSIIIFQTIVFKDIKFFLLLKLVTIHILFSSIVVLFLILVKLSIIILFLDFKQADDNLFSNLLFFIFAV